MKSNSVQFFGDTQYIFYLLHFAIILASSAGLSMGFSLRMGFEKKFWFFRPPDSSGEMPAEEAMTIQSLSNVFEQMPQLLIILTNMDPHPAGKD